jgi:hypothetical protein
MEGVFARPAPGCLHQTHHDRAVGSGRGPYDYRMTNIEGKQSITVTVLQVILSVALLVVGLLAGHYLWT